MILLFAFILLAPFHLSLDIGKTGPLVEGSIKLAWLGRTLMKAEISPQSAGDLLASIWKEKAREEKEEKEQEGREAKLEERSEIDNSADSEENGLVRPPSIQSLIDVAPALAKILLDLLKSILFKTVSCRLCFGLGDPAQTAIISGYLWSLASAFGLFPGKIFIDPWFEGERLEGELAAEMEARLLWAVFAVIQALRVREIRQLLREMLGRA
ncbi:MAG: DUF2953 domain-containing protein [Methanothrix sp.]|nr:DUF2953 domain-containing protein [Methanothrix sp.]